MGNAFSFGERIELIYLSPFNLARSQDGSGSVDQIRKWRFNLFTNYRFNNDSKLKGFTIGGGGRWQDEAAIGHPQIFDNELNVWKPDIENPHFGPSEFNMDAFVRYKRPIRDGKVDMTLTLNVRNLLNNDDLIPVAANPNEGSMGLIAVWRIPTERTYSLSAKFNF